MTRLFTRLSPHLAPAFILLAAPWLMWQFMGLSYETNDCPYFIMALKGGLTGQPIHSLYPHIFLLGWDRVLSFLYATADFPWFGLAQHLCIWLAGMLCYGALGRLFRLGPVTALAAVLLLLLVLFPYISFTRVSIFLGISGLMWLLWLPGRPVQMIVAGIAVVLGFLWRMDAVVFAYVLLTLCQAMCYLQGITLRPILLRHLWALGLIALLFAGKWVMTDTQSYEYTFNAYRIQMQDYAYAQRDTSSFSAEEQARLQLILNYSLLNYADMPLAYWAAATQRLKPRQLPLEEHWNKFYYQTIDLYRKWTNYLAFTLGILGLAILLVARTRRPRLLLRYLAAHLAFMLLAGGIAYFLKAEYRVLDWVIAAQFIWALYYVLPHIGLRRGLVAGALGLILPVVMVHATQSRDTGQLQPGAFDCLQEIRYQPQATYLFFTVKFPETSLYNETHIPGPNTRVIFAIGYCALTPDFTRQANARLGAWRVEQLVQPQVYLVGQEDMMQDLLEFMHYTNASRNYKLQKIQPLSRGAVYQITAGKTGE
ncbi:MAG: hypothetical protein KF690_02135 [Bacteroidetes bacterium]|nr:hypothetical protein [Bacteroidota bacterium]